MDSNDWPSVLTPSTHKQRGRGARAHDALCQNFLCEVCRVRAQCGHLAESPAGDRAREIERVRILTVWAGSSDSTISGISSGRQRLFALDGLLPNGCPRTVEPFGAYWPRPSKVISLQWHQIYLSNWGGQSEDGMRSAATLKQLRGVMFNEHRNRSSENIALVRMSTKFVVAHGTAPTDSVMNEQFVRGLEATLGTKAQKSAPMPPSVARALEQEFEHLFLTAQGAYAQYAAAMAQLANLQLYTNFLRGNEPWKQKWRNFAEQPFLDADCPQCGCRHLNLIIDERTKTSDRPFDLVTASPETGAGLHTLRITRRVLQQRAKIGQLLRARGKTVSEYLFIQENGRPWTNDTFWKGYGMPALRRLQTAGHPGLVGIDLNNARRTTIRMYRRGGEKFAIMAGVHQDLIDLMARWRPKAAAREPGVMRQRYYEMTCEDGHLVTASAPPRSRLGFAAWYEFENA